MDVVVGLWCWLEDIGNSLPKILPAAAAKPAACFREGASPPQLDISCLIPNHSLNRCFSIEQCRECSLRLSVLDKFEFLKDKTRSTYRLALTTVLASSQDDLFSTPTPDALTVFALPIVPQVSRLSSAQIDLFNPHPDPCYPCSSRHLSWCAYASTWHPSSLGSPASPSFPRSRPAVPRSPFPQAP